jgi:hypothetical protein
MLATFANAPISADGQRIATQVFMPSRDFGLNGGSLTLLSFRVLATLLCRHSALAWEFQIHRTRRPDGGTQQW